VQSVGKDVLDTPYISLGNGPVTEVQAIFRKEDEPRLAAIKAGELVTVECTCDGKLVWVIARKCAVQ
jgi:hypothetical protein